LAEGVQLLGRLVPDARGDWLDYRCDEPVHFVPAPSGQAVKRPCAWFSRART
jgi:hypothetical protein